MDTVVTLYLEMYDVELTFYYVNTMANQLFSTSYQKKVRCRHDVDPIRKSTKLCTVVYGKLLEFLKTMFKQLFIIYSNSLAIDSFNFLKIFEYT